MRAFRRLSIIKSGLKGILDLLSGKTPKTAPSVPKASKIFYGPTILAKTIRIERGDLFIGEKKYTIALVKVEKQENPKN